MHCLPDHHSMDSEHSAIYLPFGLLTPSDPSSSTPGPSDMMSRFTKTKNKKIQLLTSHIEQEPLFLYPAGACHATSGPTGKCFQVSKNLNKTT